MAIQSFKTVVQGNEVQVQQLPGMQAVSVKAELKDIFQDGLAELANMYAHYYVNGEEADALDQDITGVVKGLLKNIDKKEICTLIMKLMNGVTINNQDMSNQTKFDNHFAGSMVELFYVLKFVMECNFADVFQTVGLSISEDATKPI